MENKVRANDGVKYFFTTVNNFYTLSEYLLILQPKIFGFESFQCKRYSEAVPGAGPAGLRQAFGVFRQRRDYAETALRD